MAILWFNVFFMAVPKKKKSSSATKRQRNAFVISQQKKILGMAQRELRHEAGREKVEEMFPTTSAQNVTVVHA